MQHYGTRKPFKNHDVENLGPCTPDQCSAATFGVYKQAMWYNGVKKNENEKN
jgi:hypothetical protein